MAEDTNRDDVTEMTEDLYIPAETERKTAMLMYFISGIIAALHKKKLTVFEIFHLKQALGYCTVFFVVFFMSMVFFLIPFSWMRLLPVLVYFMFIVVLVIFVKQALNGRYFIQSDNGEKLFLPFFHELGGWILDTFEISIEIRR